MYVVRFVWDIVLSSSYDGSDNLGYTMWCPREGSSSLLNCVWLYLKVVQIQQTWMLWVFILKFETAWVKLTMQSFQLMSAFGKCQRDCRHEKQNYCITAALFCRHDLFCHLKVVKIFLNIYALLFILSKLLTTEKAQLSLLIVTVCDAFFQ